MKNLSLAGAAGLVVAAMAAPAARAADPEFCQDYARSAVEQAHRAEHHRSCQYLLERPQFSLDFRRHYDWCLNAHHHEADEERGRRHEALEHCEFR
jgi:hypothetical protein